MKIVRSPNGKLACIAYRDGIVAVSGTTGQLWQIEVKLWLKIEIIIFVNRKLSYQTKTKSVVKRVCDMDARFKRRGSGTATKRVCVRAARERRRAARRRAGGVARGRSRDCGGRVVRWCGRCTERCAVFGCVF